MSDNKNTFVQYLRALNLASDEAVLYLELLKEPANHLELSRKTGINRTKVYRLAEQLEKRSLVSVRTDDRGVVLTAADPSTLEIELVTEEERLKQRRALLGKIMPALNQIKARGSDSPDAFAVTTYEGVEGFKQMLWHELKTRGEVLVLGSGAIENLVPNKRWAEKHRAMTVEAGYAVRELINPGKKDETFTQNDAFMEQYDRLNLPSSILRLDHQICIYNDTVATYCWQGEQKVGYEVINAAHAAMMRQMFEHYWEVAKTLR